jgi:2',3'-cyclic-nucleotide 2'-phosphodiesterase (5'-nucleotidase family)
MGADDMKLRYRLTLACLILLLVLPNLHAEERTLTILHTNDIHDRLLPNESGLGGMPSLATAIQRNRGEREDVLLFDAGDLCEKGCKASVASHGRLMYEAIERLEYDAGVPGNHDFAHGFDQLRANVESAGCPFVCADLTVENGPPLCPPSIVLEADGMRIAVIGLITPWDMGPDPEALTAENTAALPAIVQRELDRWNDSTDIQIVLCHLGSGPCRTISCQVPDIDVFITGHSHEKLQEPIVIEETGALIAQAGGMGEYLGRLDLTIDTDENRIVDHSGRLFALYHSNFPPDEEFLEWAKHEESLVAPEAARILGSLDERVGGVPLMYLYASALRYATDADVGIDDARFLRDCLHRGVVTYDTVYKTYVPGPRRDVLTVELTGAQLRLIVSDPDSNRLAFVADLEPTEISLTATYTVAMTRAMRNYIEYRFEDADYVNEDCVTIHGFDLIELYSNTVESFLNDP